MAGHRHCRRAGEALGSAWRLPPACTIACGACLLHIGLDTMAYNAYRGPDRRDDLVRNASQVSGLI
jgi:hypothetical protein